MKTKVSFDKLVYIGVKMVLDCTPVGMAVAVLSRTNKLSVAEAVQLKAAKNQNIASIRRKMEADPDNAPANAIRSGMIERRQRSIAEAESLKAQMNVVTVE